MVTVRASIGSRQSACRLCSPVPPLRCWFLACLSVRLICRACQEGRGQRETFYLALPETQSNLPSSPFYRKKDHSPCFSNPLGSFLFPISWRIDSKELPAMRETWVGSLGQEDPPEKRMATHSSIFAWRIPWMEEPGRATIHGVTKSRTRLTNT